MLSMIKSFSKKETSNEYIEYRKLINKINSTWDNIKSGKIETVTQLKEITKSYREEMLSFSEKPQYQTNNLLFKLSENIINLQEIVEITPMDDLRPVRVILNNKFESEVYYIFNKEAVKMFATQISWFFSYYRKANIIKENNEYVLIKEYRISNLVFIANIVLNKKKEILFEKYPNEETALSFYQTLS